MYQTGVNPKVAKELWILSEQSYKCWKVLVDTDFDNIVGNAMSMTPYIKGWSEIDEAARAKVITYEQKFINASSKEKFESYNYGNFKKEVADLVVEELTKEKSLEDADCIL